MEEELFDGRYEKEKLLGQGAFSEVWKVKDSQTGVALALKIYNPSMGMDEDGIEMLTHEFALMVNASHKNLLRPLFYASCDNHPYLILPFCQRGNIGNMVGNMSEEEAWKLIRDASSALAYLHAMNPPILHQDIKPANILLSDNGDYMLTDFGVSTQARQSLSRVSNQDMTLLSAGTISYMAPERFSRNNLPIMANDIYSLGSTVFEMLSGDLPFGNDGGLLQKKGAEIPEGVDIPEGGVINVGGSVVAGGPIVSGGPVVAGGAPAGGSGTVIIGGGSGSSVPVEGDIPTVEGGTSAGGTIIIGGGSGSAVIGGGGAPVVTPNAPNPELDAATAGYVDELKHLTETLAKVSAQNEKLAHDSEEMENLNRTLTGICKVYEMQLKSASSQIGTIDDINEQTKKMAEQIAELNKIYARMIEAMTAKMNV